MSINVSSPTPSSCTNHFCLHYASSTASAINAITAITAINAIDAYGL